MQSILDAINEWIKEILIGAMKPKQSVKGGTDLDEFDFDEYDEDEPEEEADSADTEQEDEEA